MEFLRKNEAGTVDLTQMVSRYTWSGDLRSCCRILEAELLCSATDPYLPTVAVQNGDQIFFTAAHGRLFSGTVVNISKAANAPTKTIRCFDRGFYLGRNEGYYTFSNTTPEAIVRRLGGDYEIGLGAIAATGYQMSRKFLGDSLYKIIATAYTLAAAQTGEAYHIGFELDKLVVRKKQPDVGTLIVQAGSNLMNVSTSESIEKLINRVRIVDKNQKPVASQENPQSIRRYGLLQRVLEKSDDADKQAKKILADNGPTQRITLENLGDETAITGRAILIHDTYTGLWGQFWIESDTHTWNRGIYTNKLVVSFKRLMDEQEVGSLPK